VFTRRRMLAGSLAAPFFAEHKGSRASNDLETDLACCRNIRLIFRTSLDAARELAAACGACRQPPSALLDALCTEPGDRERLACGSFGQVRALLSGKILADYRDGRVRRVDGWVLSETEIRLFAIVAAT
jgi:hypothetical protein